MTVNWVKKKIGLSTQTDLDLAARILFDEAIA